MYFGSVRFFKHLILSTIALLIIVPTIIAIVFAIKSVNLEKERKNYEVLCNQTVEQLSEANKAKSNLELQFKEVEKAEKEAEVPINEPLDIDGNPIDYQLLFPDMKTDIVTKKDTGDKKIIYLTFDDGPSARTLEVLDILDLYGIQATFFVVLKDDEFSNSVYKEIVDRGHELAVHSASHDYKKIYSSVNAYLADFNKLYEHLHKITGKKPTLFRFPGGSINSYNSGVYMEIISEMTRRGFVFHDWNVSAQDASDTATDKSIFTMVTDAASARSKSIVLMHDSTARTPTVKALPRIIDDLYAKGYSFDKLDATVSPFLFSYNKPL